MKQFVGGVYEYVDLGLPSGLKWAKCNIGAEKETDFGDYFMWGETTPDTNYTWVNYKYGDGSNFSKYNTGLNGYGGTIDNKTTLDLEDDAATQIMGDGWRMPTQDEYKELIDNTEYKWFDDFNSSGVSGGKFTSKINGNSIFIPAAGTYDNGSVVDVGEEGSVWSSSLVTSNSSNALGLFFSSDYCYMGGNLRCTGLTVRGVFK